RAVYPHRRFQAGQIKSGKGPARATRMRSTPEGGAAAIIIAAECVSLGIIQIELWQIELAAFAIGIPPDEEHLVDGVGRVDFQLVIAVAAIDEDFQVIL